MFLLSIVNNSSWESSGEAVREEIYFLGVRVRIVTVEFTIDDGQ